MPEIRTDFTVAEETDDYLWLLPKEGENRGLEVPIPKESPKYSRKIRKKLSELEEKARVTAVLVNENEKNTAWRVTDISDNGSEEAPAKA